jgi:hypothetical protein
MPLPQVIANHLSLVGPLAPAAAAPPPPPPPVLANHLCFTMFQQERENWCWAAVTLSVTRFYNTTGIWTCQCQIASSGLGFVCCPIGNHSDDCDVPWFLDEALAVTNNYKTYAPGGPASFVQIQTEIDGGRPLGVRIGWNGGGGHFVCITGYAIVAGVQKIIVKDPYPASSPFPCPDVWLYSALCSNEEGTWTHSYWTKP